MSDGKGFIELFDDIVKLGNAFLVLAQPALGFFRRFLLLDLRSGTYLFCKFLLIRDSKGADGADGIQNKFPNGFCADIVTAAGVSALLMRQCIGGAIVEVRGIGAAFRAASGTVVGHLCSAVSAEHKSRQRICFTKCIVASRCLTELLCKLPRFLIHDGFVGVLKDQPFLFGIHHGIFVLVGLLVRTEVDRVPHIFGLGKNLPNDITTPVIRVGKFLLAFPNALVLFAEVNGRGFHIIIIEDTGNVIGAFALDGQSEYSADNLGGFLVDIPTVLITRHLLVAVDGAVCCRLARFAFYTDSSALLMRGTKVTLNANVLESRGNGFYSLYSADEVSDMVTEMLDSEILMSKEIKGTYGYFYILKIPQKTRQELEELNTLMGDEQSSWTETKQEEVRRNLRDGIAISDSEAERFLIYEIFRKEKSPSTYMDLINLARNPIVLVLHKLEVRNYFEDAPEMVIKFVKLRYKNAETHEKKVLKQFFLC